MQEGIFTEKNPIKKVQSSPQAPPKVLRDPATGLWKSAVEKLPQQEVAHSDQIEKILTSKLTIAKLISTSAITLAQAGINTPREDAVYLLCFVLQCSKSDLLKRWEDELTEKELVDFSAVLERRAKREPSAYIIGSVQFLGHEFFVDKRVLIPRPETELLVLEVLAAIKGWNRPEHTLLVADIGTGCGVIAICAALEFSSVKVYAVDSSEEALEMAGVNAYEFMKQAQISLLKGSFLDPVPEPVHIIAANLPYVAPEELSSLQPEIRLYEPQSALVSEKNGLAHIEALLIQAPNKLILGGKILLEIGSTQGEAVTLLARQYFPYASVEVKKDLAGLDRIVIIST